MLLWCFINGRPCNKSDFLPFLSSYYGNCFTLNTTDFLQGAEGSFDGVDIGLFLEPDEYISELTSSKGIQIVLHNTETYPFTDDDSFQINGATQTYIALKKTEIKSMSWPYGDCVDNMDQEYLQKYNYRYSYYLCNALCDKEPLVKICNCKHQRDPIYELINDAQDLSLCSESNESLQCLKAVSDNTTCDCEKGCSTNTFTYRITLSQWPSYASARYLLEYICDRTAMSNKRCDALRNQSEQNLLENFVNFNIYFDSMFVEHYTDEPDMSNIDFLTELGGCIGLWIGLSIISVFEVFQFMMDLVVAIYQARQKKNVDSNKS
ncbi:amiloride-sensitive sodium channel subunit gamma-like [Biomphalaria glabrata]|uniref:Amiloride-sensitive sodium channel subunit gamma-like n=1 Tax=Biomphalaria glabrata TaxID=6526 RepID=A0A9W3B8Q9_BIOGL|nr:amiloride-sensitive sodium channel subunit gamma-like [Biomphalaria glabrata]